jgi:PAS domain S-box-containing protein
MNEVKSRANFDLAYFLDVSPDLFCVTDYSGKFLKINPAVVKLLNHSEKEILESSIDSFVHPVDLKMTAEQWQKAVGGEAVLNFENRFKTKDGAVLWLLWTLIAVKRDKVIFASAKNMTFIRHWEEYDRISGILETIHEDHEVRFRNNSPPQPGSSHAPHQHSPVSAKTKQPQPEPSAADQLWLNDFETIVRKHTGKLNLTLTLISDELAVSERQLYRYVKRILGITPNNLVRIIRLQLAWEAIASGRHRTITEISQIAGYTSRAHFSKLFKNVYGINVSELL